MARGKLTGRRALKKLKNLETQRSGLALDIQYVLLIEFLDFTDRVSAELILTHAGRLKVHFQTRIQ